MRLFVSINFDNRIKDALTEIQDKMKLQGVRGNFTKPENLKTREFLKRILNE